MDALENDEDWGWYQMYIGQYLTQWKAKQNIEKELAYIQNKMMEIERRRPDIMQRIILENDNANNANHEE